MKARVTGFVLLLTFAFCLPAVAQYGRYSSPDYRVEISPFVGYESHGSYPIDTGTPQSINNPTIDRLRVNGAYNFGGFFDYAFNQNLQFEFMYAHNPATYSVHDFTTGEYFPAYDSSINQFQWGVLAQFRNGQKFQPFVAGGLGFTHEANTDLNPNRTVFAYNIGGGGKYFVTNHFGFRGDFRYIPTYGSSGPGLQCDQFSGQCYQATIRNYEKRVMVTGGIVFRF